MRILKTLAFLTFTKLPCLFFMQAVELSNQANKIFAAVDENDLL
jgi:hypothetical protein